MPPRVSSFYEAVSSHRHHRHHPPVVTRLSSTTPFPNHPSSTPSHLHPPASTSPARLQPLPPRPHLSHFSLTTTVDFDSNDAEMTTNKYVNTGAFTTVDNG